MVAYDTISLAARILPNGPKPRESKSRLVTSRGRRIHIISPCLCCAVLCCAPKAAVCGHPKIYFKFSLQVPIPDLVRGSFPDFRKNEAGVDGFKLSRLVCVVLCCAVLLRSPSVVTQKSILNSHCRYQFQIWSGEAFLI